MLPNKMPPKQAREKVGEYSLQDNFPGYNARKDKTTLPPNTMVAPSQNVLVGTSGRISLVPGYTLDGQSSTTIDSGIVSNYDFVNFKGDIRNLRAGFMTSAGNNGKLQFRYKNSSGSISWIDLSTALTSITMSFTTYWDNTNLIKLCLWVDGSNNIFSWNGAVTTFSSATATTLTTQGTKTWQQLGFTPTGSITIGGITATYSGGYNTTTLTGVSHDFSATTVGSEIHQTPVTTPLSSMSGILATFGPTVIGCGRQNQVYLGSSSSNNLYISKVNDYTNYTFTTPTRIVGEGDIIPLDSPPTAFIPQEVTAAEGGVSAYDMWISEGLSRWAVIRATLSNDLTSETLQHIRLKTSARQGGFSERMITKMKNHIMYLANDNTANFIGYISYEYIPTIVDFSYPIIDDMSSYASTNSFNGGQFFYHKNYAYLSVPHLSLIRVYNMTDQTKDNFSQYKAIEDVTQVPWFWEAPIGFPLAGFYVDEDGNLGGHSFTTSESFMLFKGGSFNGQEIDANATFAFDDFGDRTQSKGSNEIWVEGYIKQNTLLNTTITGDLDACQTNQTVVVDGNNQQYVCYGGGAHSLGKNPLGSQPLGGAQTSTSTLPAWFHVSKTYPQVPFYLQQISFESKGVDLQWELITFGTNSTMTVEGNNSITD